MPKRSSGEKRHFMQVAREVVEQAIGEQVDGAPLEIDTRQITTDGHKAYLQAVGNAFGADIDYAQLQKIYGAVNENETRYSPARCIGCDIKVVSGNPDPKHVSTSFVERQSLSVRMSIRRFTRLTNAFSKKIENHAAAVAIWFMYYNFCRMHQTLRVTPAMESGLSDRVWSIEEMCGLLPEMASATKRAVRYFPKT